MMYPPRLVVYRTTDGWIHHFWKASRPHGLDLFGRYHGRSFAHSERSPNRLLTCGITATTRRKVTTTRTIGTSTSKSNENKNSDNELIELVRFPVVKHLPPMETPGPQHGYGFIWTILFMFVRSICALNQSFVLHFAMAGKWRQLELQERYIGIQPDTRMNLEASCSVDFEAANGGWRPMVVYNKGLIAAKNDYNYIVIL